MDALNSHQPTDLRLGRSVEFGLDGLGDRRWDMLIGVTGYESRASAVPRILSGSATRVMLPAFDRNAVLSFDENLEFGKSIEADCSVVSADEFEYYVLRAVRLAGELIDAGEVPDRPIKVALDVSAMSRGRVAAAIVGVCGVGRDVELDIVYGPAVYEPPSSEAPWTFGGPVHPLMAGWSVSPQAPVVLMLALGYEDERAVGAVEYLEPAYTWTFSPLGHDERYEQSVAEANASLELVEQLVGRIPYRVFDPRGLGLALDEMVAGLRRWSRPVIVPFGPKIFSAMAIVVAMRNFPDVAVWRFSAREEDEPVDRQSAGEFVLQEVFVEA
jgi:hypothetical protein